MDSKFMLKPYLVITIVMIICSNFLWHTMGDAGAEDGPIKFGVNVWAPSFILYVAQEKGFFEKNNVDVQLTLVHDQQQILTDFFNGKFDGTIPVYSDVIYQNSRGLNARVVYAIDFSNTGDVIVGKGNNTGNFSLADVKGKKISVEGINSFSHLFVLKALEKVGLKEGDVEIVNVPAQNVTQELDKGMIAAGHTYQPYTTDALKKGYKVIFTAGKVPGYISDVLAFSSSFIQERPKDVEAILKSIIEAQDFYMKNKAEALKIMSAKSGVGEQEIVNGLESVSLPSLEENFNTSMNSKSNATTSLYSSGKYISEFFLDRGQISEYPDLNQILDPEFVSALYEEQNK